MQEIKSIGNLLDPFFLSQLKEVNWLVDVFYYVDHFELDVTFAYEHNNNFSK
jgi:hypothetical protein